MKRSYAAGALCLGLLLLTSWLWDRRSATTPEALSRKPVPLRIAAAADLRFALDELTTTYRRDHPTVVPEVTYGSSGTLYAQILNGAPFDLFMSADVEYPRLLAEKGLTVPDTQFMYATGRLVVWVPSSSKLNVEAGLNTLADPRVGHVAIANPMHAPYGRAAEAAMRAAKVYEAAKPKLVFGENVGQALQFVQSGAADVGIVALSLASAPSVKAAGRSWLVPADLHPRLDQAGVILQTSGVDAARDFRSYLLMDASRETLKRYGFTTSGA